jgi:hypothetical protein
MPLLLTSLFVPQGGFPTPTTPPVFEIVGEPDASGTCGATRAFEANSAFAQRYLAGHDGKVVSLFAYFSGTAAANFRLALYANDSGQPGALIAQTPGGPVAQVVGWQEFVLAEADYVDVVSSDHLWIVAQSDTSKSSCSPTSVANLARRFKSAAYSTGLPDPFGTSSAYNNTRGLRMKIWTNP